MLAKLSKKEYFFTTLSLIAVFFLCLQFFISYYVNFSVDDFWFAHAIYRYKNGLPYRDFDPYKTVLGFYLLLIPMLLSKGYETTIILLKDVHAIINVIVLCAASIWLRRYFSAKFVILSLIFLLSSHIYLYLSTNFHIDLLGYWFALFALLCLVEQRYYLAGLLLGLGFACSQKAIWYITASEVSLFFYWLIYARHLNFIHNFFRLNSTLLLVIGCYIVFWSAIAGWQPVYQSLFVEAMIMYKMVWYDETRILFWHYIISYNPLFFLLWPYTTITLLISFTDDTSYRYRFIFTVFALTLLLLLIPYKQVFPYYMQVTYGAFLPLYAGFFSWLDKIFSISELHFFVSKRWLLTLLIIYLAALAYIQVLLFLSPIYLFIALIPISLTLFCMSFQHWNAYQREIFKQVILNFFVLIFLLQTATLVKEIATHDRQYQKATLHAVSGLVKDGSQYVAGIELLYDKIQPIAGMRHLMWPAVVFLTNPTPALRESMLASLYADPTATIDTVIAAFRTSRVKFLVNNYRMDALPRRLKAFLNKQYEHAWGSIYIYAPLIPAGSKHFVIKFTGQYLLETNSNTQIQLNGHFYPANRILKLTAGTYQSRAIKSYRLRLLPPNANKIFPKQFAKDEWEKVI